MIIYYNMGLLDLGIACLEFKLVDDMLNKDKHETKRKEPKKKKKSKKR